MNNKTPSISIIYNRYKKASLTIKAPVELRITYNRKQKYISTGIMLYSNQWKAGRIVNCPDAVQISQILDTLIKNVRQAIIDMMDDGYMDIFSIPDKLKQLNTDKLTFIDFCKQRAEIRKYGKAKGSQIRYDVFIRWFCNWGGIIDFKDITEKNIILFDKHLCDKKLKESSKWANYHRFLNSFIIDAINAGHIRKNPYREIRIRKDKESCIEKYLTPDEFKKIKEAKMPTTSLERVRDVFVFQTYTCLSYSDLRDFDYTAVQEVKGIPVYTNNRHKTNHTFIIPILTPALDILHKYEGKLPVISNDCYNEYLKVVAQASGIDKPISSHWARHTGATLLLNEGVDMRIISKICGHSSTRITEQVYAKLLDETIVDAVSNITI